MSDLLTISQAARRGGYEKQVLRRLVNAGHIRAKRDKDTLHLFIDRESLDAYCRAHGREPVEGTGLVDVETAPAPESAPC